MSIRAIVWAFDQRLKPGQKLVLLKLADNANDEGTCWPSMKHVCRHTGLSKASVIRHIKALESDGYLTTKRRKQDGVNLPNVYTLNLRGVVSQCDQGSVTMTPGGGVTMTPEPSVNKTVNESKELSARVNRPDWIDEQIWTDWKRTRKAPVTPTAWARVEKQLQDGIKAGHDANEMLAEATDAGWRSFKLDWYLNRIKGSKAASTSGDQARQDLIDRAIAKRAAG